MRLIPASIVTALMLEIALRMPFVGLGLFRAWSALATARLEEWLLVRQSEVALRSAGGASDRGGCVSDVSQFAVYTT